MTDTLQAKDSSLESEKEPSLEQALRAGESEVEEEVCTKPHFDFCGDERMRELMQFLLPRKFTYLAWAVGQGDQVLSQGAVSGDKKQPADKPYTCNVASVSKVFCAVSVMMCVEAGLVELDRPVVEYLPEFKTRDSRSDKITLRHCLNHSSGLPGTMWRGFNVTDWRDDYYRDALDYFSTCTLKADPGAYSVYCNDGFTLAEMVVAKVTGQNYGQWCKEHITDPLGMESTRLTNVANSDIPTATEMDRPTERMLIGGAAGFTTTMTDLLKFGRLFLSDSPLLSRKSVQEMAQFQGQTWLASDDLSRHYGLGWDNVAVKDADFDLGAGVCQKGGNSFQFTTTFTVVPEHDLVIALSHTHDCNLSGETRACGFRVAERVLATQGVNITREADLASSAEGQKFAGPWLFPSGVADYSLTSAWAYGTWRTPHRPLSQGKALKFREGQLVSPLGDERLWVEEVDGDVFLFFKNRVHTTPMAQRAKDQALEPAAWEARLGKKWIVDSLYREDMVIHEIMLFFTVDKLEGFKGLYQLKFTGLDSSGVYDSFDAPVRALDEDHGESVLRTSCNNGRDAMHPEFYRQGGVERCKVASYDYRSVEGLPLYQEEEFSWPQEERKNSVYRFETKLEKLPEVGEGKRIIVLDDEGILTYDSGYPKAKFKGQSSGYLIFMC